MPDRPPWHHVFLARRLRRRGALRRAQHSKVAAPFHIARCARLAPDLWLATMRPTLLLHAALSEDARATLPNRNPCSRLSTSNCSLPGRSAVLDLFVATAGYRWTVPTLFSADVTSPCAFAPYVTCNSGNIT